MDRRIVIEDKILAPCSHFFFNDANVLHVQVSQLILLDEQARLSNTAMPDLTAGVCICLTIPTKTPLSQLFAQSFCPFWPSLSICLYIYPYLYVQYLALLSPCAAAEAIGVASRNLVTVARDSMATGDELLKANMPIACEQV